MRISYWSSDVCSSDLASPRRTTLRATRRRVGMRNGSSAGARHTAPSAEHPMHIPAEIARRRIDAVAAAEQPKALTAVCFDAEIVAHSPHFSGIAPPFALDALRAVPCDHPIDLSDRTSVVSGTSVSRRVELGCGGNNKKKK